MKILMASPRPPWAKSGVERVVGEMAKRMVIDNEIEILCTDPQGKEVGTHYWNDIPVHVFRAYSTMYHFSTGYYRELMNKKDGFDIIHLHNYSSFIPAVAARLKSNSPIIINPHFHISAAKPQYAVFREFYDPFIGRKILNSADRIICVSEIEKQHLLQKFSIDEQRIVIIPNGIDIASIQDAQPYDHPRKIILYVGRLVKYKNVQYLIRAMPYLPDYELVIIGDGEYKSDLGSLVNNLSLQKQVTFLNGISDHDVYRWMRTCSVLVNLSHIEAFGLTVLEALAAGKPVIVNNRGGLAELAKTFKDHVIPVEIKELSSEQLAHQIVSTSDKIVTAQLEDYSWDKITKNMEEVYSDVCE